MKHLSARGFTLTELMVSFAIVIITTTIVMSFGLNQVKLSKRTTALSTQNRIVAAVRSYAGSPPALRNSMLALDPGGSGAPANQALINCAGPPVPNLCVNGTIYALTLYSPFLLVKNGTAMVMPVFNPPSNTPAAQSRFDEFGLPCAAGQPSCPLIVSTTFTPQCGTAQQTGGNLAVGTLNTVNLQAMNTCSVAEVISVGYSISLDSTMAAQYPELISFLTPVTGSVSTSVYAITANDPQ